MSKMLFDCNALSSSNPLTKTNTCYSTKYLDINKRATFSSSMLH